VRPPTIGTTERRTPTASARRWTDWAPPLLLALVALVLRTQALGWGLPAFTEEATPFRKAAEFWGAETGRMTLDPRFFHYPSLTFYLHFVVQGLAGLFGWIGGQWASLSEFRAALATPEPALVLASRGAQALIGAATVFPAWRLGGTFGGRAGAIVAAILVAVSPTHVAESRTIGTDVPMTFAAAMALVALADIVGRGEPRDWRRAGLWIGIAASCKYPGALLGVSLLGAHLLARRRSGAPWSLFLRATGVAALAFALTSPFVLIDLPDAWHAVRFERWHMETGHFGSSDARGWGRYLFDHLPRLLGAPGFLLGLAGLALALRGGGPALPAALFALVLFAWTGSWRVVFDRYALPFLVVLAPLAGFAIGRLLGALRARWGRPAEASGASGAGAGRAVPRPSLLVRAAPWLLGLLLAIPGVDATLRESIRRNRPTTRDAALAWVRSNVPPGSLVAAERYSVEVLADSLPMLVIPFDSVRPHVYDAAYNLSFYTPFDYIVLSSSIGNRYGSRAEEFPIQSAFYDGVTRAFLPVVEFAPERERVGPTIRVYRRNPAAAAADFRELDARFLESHGAPEATSRFLVSLSGVLLRGGRDDLALSAAESAVSLTPEDPRALGTLAVLRGERGEYLATMNLYQRALAADPTDPRLHYNLGRFQESREMFREAAASYARAIDLSPAFAPAYWGLYACQLVLADASGARRTLERLLAVDPNGPRAAEVRQLLTELRRGGGS
jgi:hypothetical protein